MILINRLLSFFDLKLVRREWQSKADEQDELYNRVRLIGTMMREGASRQSVIKMDLRIIRLRKKMIECGVKLKDVKDYFGWSWTYNSALMRGKADTSNSQIQKISDSLEKIARQKKSKLEAA